jgi:hypothetical protein
MKKRMYVMAGLLAASATATTAMAQPPQNPLYVAGKIGVMDARFSGFGNATNLGIAVGYDFFTEFNGIWSAEGEFTTTIADGKVPGGGDWDVDTLAAYATYRTLGEFYLKAKAGVQRQDIKRAGGDLTIEIPDAKDTTFAFGIGGGFQLDRTSGFEVEVTRLSSQLRFMSVSYVMRF